MANSKVSRYYDDLCFGSFMIEERLWDEDRVRIQWISLYNYDIAEMTKTIIASINDQARAKNILVLSYQKFIGVMDTQVIVSHLREIVNATRGQTRNKVLFGTAKFVT